MGKNRNASLSASAAALAAAGAAAAEPSARTGPAPLTTAAPAQALLNLARAQVKLAAFPGQPVPLSLRQAVSDAADAFEASLTGDAILAQGAEAVEGVAPLHEEKLNAKLEDLHERIAQLESAGAGGDTADAKLRDLHERLQKLEGRADGAPQASETAAGTQLELNSDQAPG